MADLTDEEIASHVKSGQTFWFAILVERYEERLSRYAKRFLFSDLDSEDLIQEIFTKAFINIQSFDESRKFSPWIYRIAHNEFVNALKKRTNEPLTFLDPDTIFPQSTRDEEPRDSSEL